MDTTAVAIAGKHQEILEALVDLINGNASLKLRAALDFDRAQVHSLRGAFVYSIWRERKTIWVRDHSLLDDADFHSHGWDLENDDGGRLLDDLAYFFGWHAGEAVVRAHAKMRVGFLMADALSNDIDMDPEE